jgi:hypothetical protein
MPANDSTSGSLTVLDAVTLLPALDSATADTAETPTSDVPAESAPAPDAAEQQEVPAEEPAADPDAPAEPEAEAAETPETSEQPQVYTVKVDGQELQVTLDEALKGYQRTADYTRKTQQLAELRKTHEAELAQYRTTRDQYAERLGKLETVINQAQPPEPDWAKLRAEDPDRYAAEFADWNLMQTQRQKIVAERQRVEAEQQREQLEVRQQQVEAERAKLAAALPELVDAEQGPKRREALISYATAQGITAQELADTVDHRVLVALEKARRWDELQLQRKVLPMKRVTTQDTKTLTPGTPKAAPTRAEKVKDDAMATFRKTGKVADAAAALLALEAIKKG